MGIKQTMALDGRTALLTLKLLDLLIAAKNTKNKDKETIGRKGKQKWLNKTLLHCLAQSLMITTKVFLQPA